jgi:hypothetical protein
MPENAHIWSMGAALMRAPGLGVTVYIPRMTRVVTYDNQGEFRLAVGLSAGERWT